MPKGIPLTGEEQNKRRHEVFAASVNLFLEKGFRETTMQEIAQAAKLGKSTLYDYFKNKDEILIYFFEDQLNDMTREAQKIALQNKPADERLREILTMHLELLQSNKNLFMKLSLEAQRLNPHSQKQVQTKRHNYQDLLRALIAEGISEGVFRNVDALLAARILLSSLEPAVFSSRPISTSQEIVKETLDILFKGIEAN